MDVIRIIVAILLPPLGVFLQEGLRKHFWINVLLTILGYIPGIIHAVYIIVKHEPRRLSRTREASPRGTLGPRRHSRGAG